VRRARGQQAALASPTLRDAAAGATVGGAADAAHQALAANGSAVDAVVAGFFAAAGLDPGVLLGSAAAIVGNVGSGVRAFDGRPLQPGKGAPRPRGFVEGVAVPSAAYVGVPRAVPMVMLLHTYGGRSGLSALAKYGADAATSVDAKTRAKVLRRVGAAGPLGLRTEGVHDALLAAGNSLAGGVLTEEDLESALPADADGRALSVPLPRSAAGGGAPVEAEPRVPVEDESRVPVEGAEAGVSVSVWPWSADGVSGADPGWIIDVIVAADARGNVAALSYAHQPEGIALPAVELAVPLSAVPVRRGVTRIPPGAVLRVPAPIGIVRLGREVALSFGLSAAWDRGARSLFPGEMDVSAFAPLAEGSAVEPTLGALAKSNGAARTIAAVRAPRSTRTAVVVPEMAS
jgi:hypothetical protein